MLEFKISICHNGYMQCWYIVRAYSHRASALTLALTLLKRTRIYLIYDASTDADAWYEWCNLNQCISFKCQHWCSSPIILDSTCWRLSWSWGGGPYHRQVQSWSVEKLFIRNNKRLQYWNWDGPKYLQPIKRKDLGPPPT